MRTQLSSSVRCEVATVEVRLVQYPISRDRRQSSDDGCLWMSTIAHRRTAGRTRRGGEEAGGSGVSCLRFKLLDFHVDAPCSMGAGPRTPHRLPSRIVPCCSCPGDSMLTYSYAKVHSYCMLATRVQTRRRDRPWLDHLFVVGGHLHLDTMSLATTLVLFVRAWTTTIWYSVLILLRGMQIADVRHLLRTQRTHM